MITEVNSKIDDLWMIVVALEIMGMQLGFILLEIGTIRKKNSRNVIYKNLADFFVSTITFCLIGYRISTDAQGGLNGSGNFLDIGFESIDYRNWIVSFGFCTTACTAVSGALAERTFLDTYVCFSFIMSSLIYPVIACWAWGGGFL